MTGRFERWIVFSPRPQQFARASTICWPYAAAPTTRPEPYASSRAAPCRRRCSAPLGTVGADSRGRPGAVRDRHGARGARPLRFASRARASARGRRRCGAVAVAGTGTRAAAAARAELIHCSRPRGRIALRRVTSQRSGFILTASRRRMHAPRVAGVRSSSISSDCSRLHVLRDATFVAAAIRNRRRTGSEARASASRTCARRSRCCRARQGPS